VARFPVIVTRQQLAVRVLKGSVALDIAKEVAYDLWSIFSSTNLWDVCNPPAAFGLPPGSVRLFIKIWERVSGEASPGGIPHEILDTAVAQGESCFPLVIETLSKYSDAQTMQVDCNGSWSFSPYYPAAVLLANALGQGKARQRGTVATRSGLNRLCLRVPHR